MKNIQRYLLIFNKQLRMFMKIQKTIIKQKMKNDNRYGTGMEEQILIIYMEAKEKLKLIVVELFMRGRKPNIYLVSVS